MANALETRIPFSLKNSPQANELGGFSWEDYEAFFRRNEGTGHLAQVWSDVLFRLTADDALPPEVLQDSTLQM